MSSTVTDAAGALPQLSFQFVNQATGKITPDVIYITDDVTYNQVSLSISLTTGSAALSPGTIPDPNTPPLSGTTLYVDLTALQLSAAAWDAMTFDGDGWSFQKFASQGVVGMTPSRDLTLDAGTSGAIPISFGGIVVPRALATSQVQIYVSYYGIPAASGTYSTFAVAIQNRPDDRSKDLADALRVSLSATGIVNSIPPLLKAANLFSLRFESTQTVQAKAGPDTVFTVTFVYGAAGDPYGFGALTDVANANQIDAAAGVNADKWTITRNSGAQSTSWTLQPPDDAWIVGTGTQSIVGIDFSNVVTTYQPGPTTMLISYTKVPGYKDGTFALVLTKVPHVEIRSLGVTPNPTYFSRGEARVEVTWDVGSPQSLELKQNYLPTRVTGQTDTPAVLDTERTMFTLRATGAPGTVENVDYRSVPAIALPVINSFTGTPTEIYSGSLTHDATFAWAVDSSDGVTLSSTGGAFSGQSFNAIGSTSQSISQPQLITLAPTTAANPLSLTRKLVISAFTPTPKAYRLGFVPAAVAASPTGPFLVVAGPASSLTVVDTVAYGTVATVPLGHIATALAFSADGTSLATANTDGTIAVLTVSLGPDGIPVFGAPLAVNVGATPKQLVFSPSGPRIFATTVGSGAGRGQVASLLGASGSYALEATVDVGNQPRGLTLDAGGARLFVANSADDTLSRIGLTDSGALGSATTIHQITGGPTAIVASPSGKQLLVSCATANTVIALDPDRPETGQRQTLHVGRTPGQIAITPAGAYAFVVNTGERSVSLIDAWGLPSRAGVLGTGVAIDDQPLGISISPDGLQVMVTTSSGFTLITLATYHAPARSPSLANSPTSVEVTPGGELVFAWHDDAIPAPSASPGILVYAPESGVTSNLLADQRVLRCVPSPDPLAKQALAIVAGDPQLHLIATDQLAATTLSLDLATGTSPVALAIAGEGQTLFTAVADASRELSLVVHQLKAQVWTKVQTLALFQARTAGRILLRSTPDGTTVFLVDVGAAQVRAIRQVGGRYQLAPTTITSDLRALDLAVLPDGSTAYVLNAGHTTNTITVVDVASLASHTAAIPQRYVRLTGLQPSPDGRRLFATDASASALRVLDARSLRIVQTIPLAADPNDAAGASGLAVMPDGSQIFTANMLSKTLGIVEQIQMGTGLRERGLDRFRARVTGLAAVRATRAVAAPSALGAAAGDVYSGLFIRHRLGETPTLPTQGWSESPDVILHGGNIEPDLSTFTTAAGYAKDFGSTVNINNDNYVYLRGLNTTNAPITSRAYFYHTRATLAMWPSNWTSDFITVDRAAQNWVDIAAPANTGPGTGVGVGQRALLWNAKSFDPSQGDHYCVILWVDNSRNPQPPDLASYSKFQSFDDLVRFVVSHHNLGWRNTYDIFTPPPKFSYNSAVSVKAAGGAVYLNIAFSSDIPDNATFTVNVQGPDPDNSVALPATKVQSCRGGYQPPNNPLLFPSNFATSVQVQLWPDKDTPIPPTAKINVRLFVQTADSLRSDIERMYRPMGLRTPYRRVVSRFASMGIPAVTIGSTTFNLKLGAKPGGQR